MDDDRRGRLTRALVVVAVLAVAGSGSGCTGAGTTISGSSERKNRTMSAQQTPATRGRPGPVRTDVAPLTRRFPVLGTPVSATWQTGTLGDPDAPGPSSYWIDAAVQLARDDLRALPPATQLQPAGAPEVAPGVRTTLPAGEWVAGPALARALAGHGYGVTGYLAPDAGVLVLRATGSG